MAVVRVRRGRSVVVLAPLGTADRAARRAHAVRVAADRGGGGGARALARRRVLGADRREPRWIDRRSSAVRVAAAPVSIEADLSRRRVEHRRGDRVVKSVRVAIGRSGSPTPTGRFAITDKLQGVLSFGIPFALVPTILLTRRRDLMGDLVNRPLTTAGASVVAALIIGLNGFLLYGTFFG
jgi:hypothetical protein